MDNQSKNSKALGITALVIVFIALIVLFNVSALLGGFLYLIAFGLSIYQLKSKVSYEDTFSIMTFVKNIRRDNFWEEGVFTIIVILLPVIVIITMYRWIVVDTVREVNSLYDQIE